MPASPCGAIIGRVGAQRIATGIGLAALAALLVNVGLPAIRSPAQVPEVEIVVPVGDSEEGPPAGTPQPVPPTREADGEDGDRDRDDDSPGGGPAGGPDGDDDDDDDRGDDSPDDGGDGDDDD